MDKLKEMGIEDGDIIKVKDYEFEYWDEDLDEDIDGEFDEDFDEEFELDEYDEFDGESKDENR